jgi:hypothetical protein
MGQRSAGTWVDLDEPSSHRPSDAGSARGRAVRPGGAATRSLDEEAAFAARRAQYLQDLRQAIAEVKRSYAVRVARNDPVRGVE